MAQFSIQPSGKDCYLDKNEATTAHDGTFTAVLNNATYMYRILEYFDVSGYTGGSGAITSAIMSLRVIDDHATPVDGVTLTVSKCTRTNWTGAGATWNKYDGTTDWTTAGGDYVTTNPAQGSALFSGTSEAWIDIDITAIVVDAIDNVTGLVSVIVTSDGVGATPEYCASDTYATEALRPKLVINYTVNYSIAVDVGAFTLTGIAVGLLRPIINMAVAVGSFVLTGINAGLSKGYNLITTVGEFVLTGINVNLLRPIWNMAVSVGEFTLTGIDVGFTRAMTMIVSAGEFILTGIDVNFLRPIRNMAVSVGEFILTGKDVLFNRGYNMAVSVGEFVLTGINVILRKGYNLICSVGEFILTGFNIVFRGQGSWKMKGIAKSASPTITGIAKHIGTLTNITKHSSNLTNIEKS